MKKREAAFTTIFRHWLKANPMNSGAFELKQTTTNSLPFSAVKEHQIDALLAVRRGAFSYKIADDSIGFKPYDLVYYNRAGAWVVIKYPKEFHIIFIETFVREKEISKRKSLTLERAREISIVGISK